MKRASSSFATNVSKYRTELGYSQEKLAEKANVHRTFIGYIERGERIPTLDFAEKISKALGKELKEMI